jgi:hypothetical protein
MGFCSKIKVSWSDPIFIFSETRFVFVFSDKRFAIWFKDIKSIGLWDIWLVDFLIVPGVQMSSLMEILSVAGWPRDRIFEFMRRLDFYGPLIWVMVKILWSFSWNFPLHFQAIIRRSVNLCRSWFVHDLLILNDKLHLSRPAERFTKLQQTKESQSNQKKTRHCSCKHFKNTPKKFKFKFSSLFGWIFGFRSFCRIKF